MQNRTKPRNLQDAFNRIWRHFIIQGYGQSRDITGRCAYRGEKKNAPACAVGCMLPTKLARRADKLGVSSVLNASIKIPEFDRWFENVDLADLGRLQFFHDNSFRDIKRELKSFAERKNLTIPKR